MKKKNICQSCGKVGRMLLIIGYCLLPIMQFAGSCSLNHAVADAVYITAILSLVLSLISGKWLSLLGAILLSFFAAALTCA